MTQANKKDQPTILLVEDDAVYALELSEMLQLHGYQVRSLPDGTAAISFIADRNKSDLILMDIHLCSNPDGITTAARILELQEVPVVFLTSDTSFSTLEKISGLGYYGYIDKSSHYAVLLGAIQLAMRCFESTVQRKRKEAAIHRSEDKARKIVNGINDAVFLFPLTVDGAGLFEDVNDTACLLYGYSRQEFLGLAMLDLVEDSDDNLAVMQKCAVNLLQQGTVFCEMNHVNRNKRIFPAEINASLIDLDDRRMALAVVRNITERRKTEEALRLSEKNYERLINGMADTAWVIGLDGRIIDVNNKAIEVFGYTREEFHKIGLAGIDKHLSPVKIAKLVNDLPKDRHQIFETAHTTKSGKSFPVEISSTYVIYGGKPAILSIARDISDRKAIQAELRQQLAEKETLLKAVHHRMKNNIASVESLLNMQSRAITSPEAKKALRDAIGRVECVRVLYETLLNTRNYRKISAKTFLENVCNSLGELFSADNSLRMEYQLDDFPLPENALFPIGVIVEELVTNCFKYASNDSTKSIIRVSFRQMDSHAVLEVGDNGRGYPEGFSLQSSKGFGLMIVKMLVKQLDAKLELGHHNGASTRITFNQADWQMETNK